MLRQLLLLTACFIGLVFVASWLIFRDMQSLRAHVSKHGRMDLVWGVGMLFVPFAIVVGLVYASGSLTDPDDAGTSADGGGEVDPGSQQPGCHRYALAYAANHDPNFEWNVTGMDLYSREYDSCVTLSDQLDS